MPSLHDAIDPDTARALLAEGANVHWIDTDGLTPLYRAALRNDLALIEVYLATNPIAAENLRAAAPLPQGGASLLSSSPARQTSHRTINPSTNQKDTQPQETSHG